MTECPNPLTFGQRAKPSLSGRVDRFVSRLLGFDVGRILCLTLKWPALWSIWHLAYRRIKTLTKKAYELGMHDNVEVALIIIKNGRFITYRSLGHES